MKTTVFVLLFLLASAFVSPADAWWGHDYRHYRHDYRYRSYRYDYYPRRYDSYDRQRYYCCGDDDKYEVGRERPRQTFRLKKPDGTEIETVR